MRRKAWFFKDRTVLGILGVMLVFITLATGCPTGEETTAYTVTFDVDGGSPAPASQSVASGGKVTKPTDPTKAGYTFDGWYKEAAKTNLWNFDTDVVTANMTLYAKWTETVTITFNTNGGSAIAPAVVAKGSSVSLSEYQTTMADYTFGGWHTNEALTTPANSSMTITTNITLYAKWIESKTFTVTFSGFADEQIDLSHEGELTLSKSNYDNLTVSLSGVKNYDSIMWYEDGSYRGNSDEGHFVYASSFSLGPHTLSAVVVKDGVPYSKTLTFQVSK
ncbi:MAG: InlB B-repeat-containing protein [Treponema sp.]|jgi:uncharacterized repeat protein (TIGR02543 family)|nr:InlB B-repeat-containing protein [Treponema sp.]